MSLSKPHIILVDDHELFRDGIKTMIELENIATVIGEASNGEDFLSMLEKHQPDLVLMDIDMPGMNGIEATTKALKLFPSLQVLVLSMFGNEYYYTQMIDAGAKGFILKSSNKTVLLEGIEAVLKGNNYFSNELLEDILAKFLYRKSKNSNSIVQFSEKEKEILLFMCQGLSNDEIAEKVYLTSKTISNYRTTMMQKAGCNNSTSLVVYAIKHQIIKL